LAPLAASSGIPNGVVIFSALQRLKRGMAPFSRSPGPKGAQGCGSPLW
jgi:hypothetical protein